MSRFDRKDQSAARNDSPPARNPNYRGQHPKPYRAGGNNRSSRGSLPHSQKRDRVQSPPSASSASRERGAKRMASPHLFILDAPGKLTLVRAQELIEQICVQVQLPVPTDYISSGKNIKLTFSTADKARDFLLNSGKVVRLNRTICKLSLKEDKPVKAAPLPSLWCVTNWTPKGKPEKFASYFGAITAAYLLPGRGIAYRFRNNGSALLLKNMSSPVKSFIDPGDGSSLDIQVYTSPPSEVDEAELVEVDTKQVHATSASLLMSGDILRDTLPDTVKRWFC